MATKRAPLDIVASARRHIARVAQWTAGLDAASYEADELKRYACERAFIAIGEAMRDLTTKVELSKIAPNGPWADPVRFRNYLAHDYDDQVIPAVMWDTITRDLPELDAALAALEATLIETPQN